MVAKKSKKADTVANKELEDTEDDHSTMQDAADNDDSMSHSNSSEDESFARDDEIEEEDEEEDEEDEEEESGAAKGAVPSKGRPSKGINKSSVRSRGLRKAARMAGYIQTCSRAASGKDALVPLITPHDVKRMMKYVPAGHGHSFGSKELEFRQSLVGEKITPNALQEAQARLDRKLRDIMNQCVVHIARKGARRVNADVMHSIINTTSQETELTSVQPPPGLIKAAMDAKKLYKDNRFDNVKESKRADGSKDAKRKAARAANKAQVKASASKASVPA